MDRLMRQTRPGVGVVLIILGLVMAFSVGAAIASVPHSAAASGPVASHTAASPLSASTIHSATATAALSLTPSTGVVGITVTANGTGFTALTAISTFTFNGTTPTVQTCTAQTTNATGFFSCTFVVPAHVPSANDVNATGSDGGADNATAVFTIPEPAIALAPSSGAPGIVVGVSGSGFTRLTAIATFTFNGATLALQTCTSQTTSGLGEFACTFVAPLGLLPAPTRSRP